MWAVIGIYTGREGNIFWRRVPGGRNGKLEAAGAKALGERDAEPLGHSIIHSVTNPIGRLTGAIHVYAGDFFREERSEWDPETLPRALRRRSGDAPVRGSQRRPMRVDSANLAYPRSPASRAAQASSFSRAPSRAAVCSNSTTRSIPASRYRFSRSASCGGAKTLIGSSS